MIPESCCGEWHGLERSLLLYLFSRIVVGLVKCPATVGRLYHLLLTRGKEHHRKAGRKICKSQSQRLGRPRAQLSFWCDGTHVHRSSQHWDCLLMMKPVNILAWGRVHSLPHPSNWGAVDSWWLVGNRESVFFGGGVSSGGTVTCDPTPGEYRQHKLDSLTYKNRKRRQEVVGSREVRVGLRGWVEWIWYPVYNYQRINKKIILK